MTYLNIKMYRWYRESDTTLGIFEVFGNVFFTAENTKKILPSGEYICQLRSGATTNRSAGLDCVYSILEDIPDRDSFQFAHVGNSYLDVKGCIAIGLDFNMGSTSILNSIRAVKKFYKLLDEKIGLNPIKLTIIE